ncbi:MAG: SMC-Scp complex subunit ScpB [Oscillospiraceae bacterium]|nr:SMC-Scp complex subunit ScpB [Oscillospiraceae bacterium]
MIGTLEHDIESAVEAMLFASGEPLAVKRMASVLNIEPEEVERYADALSDKYSFERRGLRVVKLEDSYQMCSSPEHADLIRLVLETRKPPQLSQPALEVLAIVAYFQPVTRAYIEQVRGVDCTYTVKMLSERGLIEDAGRLEVPGRPMLFKTTKVFLRTFGLKSLADLPELPEKQPDVDSQQKLEQAIAALMPEEEKSDDGSNSEEGRS